MSPVSVGNSMRMSGGFLGTSGAQCALREASAQFRKTLAAFTLGTVVGMTSASSAQTLAAIASIAPMTESDKTGTIESFHVQSRELVDLELTRDGALTILISSPGTAAPGLYRWSADEPRPSKLCDIASPSFFSFDRKVIIERERGNPSSIRLYRPKDCALLARLDIEGRVLDIDVRGTRIAAAVRLPGNDLALRLYDRSGVLQASTSIGRNVEMGFSPDGRMLLNFDLSDSGPRAWSIPNLAPVHLPRWLNEGEVTFVAGSPFVKRYASNLLSIARWPTGHIEHTLSATAATRIRALSSSGAVALIHEFRQQRDVLEWAEARSGLRIQMAQGSARSSIDHAAISPDAKRVAWSFRSGASQHVVVQRRMAPASGVSEPIVEPADSEPAMEPPPPAPASAKASLPPAAGVLANSLAPQPAASAPRQATPSLAPTPSTSPISAPTIAPTK